jgi:hypothetical protein
LEQRNGRIDRKLHPAKQIVRERPSTRERRISKTVGMICHDIIVMANGATITAYW